MPGGKNICCQMLKLQQFQQPQQVQPQQLGWGVEITYHDLDANGVTEKISFVGSGGGFLALDKNSDGVVNDGRELFGAATGQGFKELAEYDSDNNNWINENDLNL